jgi:hypothetical protein
MSRAKPTVHPVARLTGPRLPSEPARVDDRGYDQWVTQLAADLGVREADVAYTVAYRAACQTSSTSRHTAA